MSNNKIPLVKLSSDRLSKEIDNLLDEQSKLKIKQNKDFFTYKKLKIISLLL